MTQRQDAAKTPPAYVVSHVQRPREFMNMDNG